MLLLSVGLLQVPTAHQPAELAKQEWTVISQSPPWAIDAWGLGCLMQETFNSKPLTRTEELRNLDNIPKPVHQVISLANF